MASRSKSRKSVAVIVPKLLPDTKAEVRSLEEGFLGSWHPATVISGGDLTRNVKYDHLLSDEGTDHLTECIKVSSYVGGEDDPDGLPHNYRGIIRPSPPSLDLRQWSLHYGQCVDVYHNDAWWEGVIFDHEDGSAERTIFFPDIGDEMKAHAATLRITQDWDEMLDNWQPRGNWLFLELIEEIEQQWPLLVSVKQIWYDTRAAGFEDIGEWTNADRDTWRKWVSQVWYDNLKIAIKQVFDELNSSGLLQEDQLLVELSEPVLDAILKPETFTGNSIPIIPFGLPDCLNSHETACSSKPSLEEVLLLPSTSEPRPSSRNHCSEIICVENGKESLSKTAKRKIEWLPVSPDMLPEPGLYPDAIFSYGDSQSKTKKLIPKVKGHLLSLNWKIYFNKEILSRLRYVSPEGVCYYSLREVCRLLKEKSQLQPLPEDKQRSLSMYTEHDQSSLLPDIQSDPMNLCSSEGLLPSHKRKSETLKKKSKVRVKRLKRVDEPNSDDVDAFLERQTLVVRDGSKIPVSNSQPTEVELEKGSFEKRCLSEKIQVESSSGMLLLENPAENSKAKDRGTRKRKRRNSIVADISLHRTKGQSIGPRLLNNGLTSQHLFNFGENEHADCSTRVLRSSKRPIEEVNPSLHHSPRTVLSWLIDNNAVIAGQNVYYREKDSETILIEGKITRDGIRCCCCHCTFSISKFEIHAGINFHGASENIFLEDGRSLLNCQFQLESEKKSRSSRTKSSDVKGNSQLTNNDYICSVCHDGGDLVLCDQCPSSYHKECVNMKVIPEGDWFCPSCCCGICGNGFDRNMEFASDNSGLSCSQCERQYHLRCVQDKGLMQNTRDLDGNWFCNENCRKIFQGLHQLLGKAVSVGDDNLTWTLVKYREDEDGNCDEHHNGSSIATYGKLSIALSVMHECFLPVKEPLTQSDIIEDMLFCRRSELRRLNFQGFYTVLLEKNEELITAATTLMQLGVERLVLPSVETALDTWTTSFGFSKMTVSDRLKFLSYTFLNFPGAIMCQKLLQENVSLTSSSKKGSETITFSNINEASLRNIDGNSGDSEVYQADGVEEEQL
ncbi:hypothetical protein Leryth_000304 [Lithospermum erythrorhizon]|nr:hypothetical protein Leryth_000304 [Lithospermum erythrorhizon]